jgi:hypothetical protein
MDIERHLRRSLAAREPPVDQTAAVLARIQAGGRQTPPRRQPRWRLPAALAATVLAAAAGLHWHAARQREVRNYEQLLLALAITSHGLDRVQQKLMHADAPPAGEGTP